MEEKKHGAVEQNMEGGSTEQAKKRKTLFAVLASLAAIACTIAAVFVIRTVHEANEQRRREEEAQRQAIIQSGVIHAGITVSGISVGGMDLEQAEKALAPVEKEIEDGIGCMLMLDGEAFSLQAKSLGVAFNTAAVLDEAMQIGRDGTLEELLTLLEELSLSGRNFELDYSADEKILRTYIAELAKTVFRAPVDASFAMLVDKETITEKERKSEEFVKAASTTTHEERMRFEAEEEGITLDEEALFTALMAMAAKKEYADMELPIIRTQPEITLENIQAKIVLRGAFSSSFAKSPYNRATRVFNIRKAVSLVNGTVLQPGEIFSTNGVLGNRTYSAGWKPAPAIVRGRTEDQAGGGVCQVSSTLYNCVLMSDLEIVHRQGHSGRVSYVEGGLDATIDSGRIDFTWKNSTEHPLYVFSWVDMDAKRLHFEIYGEPLPEEYDEIKLSSKKVSNVSPSGSMQYTVDYSKPVGYKSVYVARKSGSVWQSYAAYYKNGVEVKTEKVDKTTYKAYAGETIIGPSATSQVGGYVY